MSSPATNEPAAEWSQRIRELLTHMKLSQAALAERLGVSPSTVTRWIKGSHEPTSAAYVALGNMSDPSQGIYFWQRAGIDPVNIPAGHARTPVSSLQVRLGDFNLVKASRISSRAIASKSAAVALPLLNLVAYGDRVPPGPHVTLADAGVEDVLMAPLEWCPHPESMIGLRVEGDSMVPIIPPGAIIAVDTAVTSRDDLNKGLAVFSHRDLGFKWRVCSGCLRPTSLSLPITSACRWMSLTSPSGRR